MRHCLLTSKYVSGWLVSDATKLTTIHCSFILMRLLLDLNEIEIDHFETFGSTNYHNNT